MTGPLRDAIRSIDRRAVALFVGLDLTTYVLVFWLLVPSFSRVLLAVPPMTAAAVGWVLSIVRLTLVSVVVVRSSRSRRGLVARPDVVPTMVTAGLVAWCVQLVLGVAAALLVGAPVWRWRMLLDLVAWVGFALVGILFVSPGQPERLPLRYRLAAERDRGSLSLWLLPAVVALVTVTLLAVVGIGSATNDRRESSTAADAAALAAADAWRDRVGVAFGAAWSATDPVGFWAFAGTDLGSLADGSLSAAASSYAAANGAQLRSLSVDPVRGQVTVQVENDAAVPTNGRHVQAVATARLRFESGACRSGRLLGFLVGASCSTSAPAATPTASPTPGPTPSPSDSPAPPPFVRPAGIGGFDVQAELTGNR
ncbi:MAG: hypothetical protein BGO38_14990 [Cellulomonas sp. 73-145]|uniref:pilus assembly protein TadG-related protein n=1 Tax=Cellulomonas sp. 73-145 TaxID=1895739 RepID=UPI00092CD4AF|nr:pilus assembly protein TadG-related protein [Cellulomonas sp. 73-145]OJV58699.1 MAG: hypothetical protein BGO38_14990 [Cellulomonas sp. 73-145]